MTAPRDAGNPAAGVAYNRAMDDLPGRGDLVARERLAELGVRSDARGLARLGRHLALLAATAALLAAARGTVWVAPAVVAYGAVLMFLFAGLHESIHMTAFRSRWFNHAVAWAVGALVVLPPTYFRHFHFDHHRHTQDGARDPELAAPKPATLAAYLFHLTGLPLWGERLVTTWHQTRGRVAHPFVPARAAPRVVAEARALCVGYAVLGAWAVVGGWWPEVLLYWIVPALAGQPFLRAFLLAEHSGCAQGPDMLANSRTTLTHPLVRLLGWNMSYHAEHHSFPSVPFHALPALHRDLRAYLAVVTPGYAAFHRGFVSDLLSAR